MLFCILSYGWQDLSARFHNLELVSRQQKQQCKYATLLSCGLYFTLQSESVMARCLPKNCKPNLNTTYSLLFLCLCRQQCFKFNILFWWQNTASLWQEVWRTYLSACMFQISFCVRLFVGHCSLKQNHWLVDWLID